MSNHSPASTPDPDDSAPDFPGSFLWGAATSSHQVEGGNVNNDWWQFEHTPGTAARWSSGDGIDHLHRYAEDFRLLAGLGHSAHRLSVEWSRVEPAPGELSRTALDHYRRVLRSVREHGMATFVTLHHFTLPVWFADRGGWLGPDAVATFSQYCAVVMEALGDLVEFACTINEPQMVALHGYLEGYHPPGITNAVLWRQVGRVLVEAHQAAVEVVRRTSSSAPGLAVQLPVLVPRHDDAVSHRFCAELRHEIVDLHLDDLSPGAGGDWLGVQYYRRQYVDPSSPTLFVVPPPGERTTQMGWAVHPEGLTEVLHRAARTGLPLVVTENGIATSDDDERIDYLEGHLSAMRRAMDEGVDVRGYLHWSAFDNFEWSEGYRPTFGLVGVDRVDLSRTPRPSAHAFARVARMGRLAALRSG